MYTYERSVYTVVLRIDTHFYFGNLAYRVVVYFAQVGKDAQAAQRQQPYSHRQVGHQLQKYAKDEYVS